MAPSPRYAAQTLGRSLRSEARVVHRHCPPVIAAIALFACSCTGVPTAAPSRIPLGVCQLAQSSDFIGRFEIVRAADSLTSFGLRTTRLRLAEPVLASPPNDSRVHAASSPVAVVRAAQVGHELDADLELDTRVTPVGSVVTVFLVWSSRYSVWADFNGQGVFAEGPDGLSNNTVYTRPVPRTQFLKIVDEGSRLSRTGAANCPSEVVFSVGPADSGSPGLERDGG